ncbi:MAG TPA: dihydrodipicolinate synthase family protein [Candidatus Saccharimonadales bacterium]|nr:dihydrodipicolinate synthase family protein [Candidatus Saccharimonadales bacterium]
MTGPIATVHPPFDRDGAIDWAGLRTEIERNLAAGSGTMLLTFGDSLHSLITDAEVGELLRVVVAQTRGRALVVAADRQWWTGREIEFADFARDAGADVLMVLPPSWGGGVTHDSLVAHYRAVSEHLPVMVVTGLFLANQALGLRVIDTLVEQVPGIVAIKDDVTGEFARRMALLVHDRWAVLSGGQKQHHLDLHLYGCDGYMSTYLHFRPEIAHAYWAAVQAGDLAAAARILRDFDQPWFMFAESLGGGFDAMYHGAQEVFGIASRWRRLPYHSLTDAEMERLRAFFSGLPPVERAAATASPAVAESSTPAPRARG